MRFSKEDGNLYDVVAVSLDDNSILWVDEKKTLPNAEAVVAMAVMRQGVEDRFFSPTPSGTYKQGDKWSGNKMPETEPEPYDPDAHIVELAQKSPDELFSPSIDEFAEIIATELSVHQPDANKVLSGFKCRICGSPLVLTHRNASLGQEYAVDETDPVYQAGAPSPVQPWCDHCSADLNDVRHILCEKCYRRFDSDEHTRAVAGLSDDEKALYPHTLKGKDNAN